MAGNVYFRPAANYLHPGVDLSPVVWQFLFSYAF